MTTQNTQAQQPQPKEEQAEKLRRVLSVKDPVQSKDKPAAPQPKPPVR
jgi:hypothetical protein